MKLSDFMTLKAVVSVVYALGALLVPGLLLVFHGARADDFGQLLARYYGALLLGVALICWFIKNAEDSAMRRGILLALFVADTLGFIVALLAQLSGMMNFLGWVDAAIWLVLAVGLGYFRFLQPRSG
jgi:hypothetical protein